MIMMMNSSDEENSKSISPTKKGKVIDKEFIILHKKHSFVPRGDDIDHLKLKGMVRHILINTAWTGNMLFDQLKSAFPCLNETTKEQ